MWGSKFQNYVRNETPNFLCPVGLIRVKCPWLAKVSLLKPPTLTMIQSIVFLAMFIWRINRLPVEQRQKSGCFESKLGLTGYINL